MKKFALFIAVMFLSVFLMPAMAGGGPVLYGVVVNIAGPYGPIDVEGIDGLTFQAWPVGDAPMDKLYLGCEVSAQLDVNGKVYVPNIAKESENPMQKLSWVAEVLDCQDDSNEVIVSTPVGPQRLFVSNGQFKEMDIKNGSLLRIVAFKTPWMGHFILIDSELLVR